MPCLVYFPAGVALSAGAALVGAGVAAVGCVETYNARFTATARASSAS
jgi:hypothetical protein